MHREQLQRHVDVHLHELIGMSKAIIHNMEFLFVFSEFVIRDMFWTQHP